MSLYGLMSTMETRPSQIQAESSSSGATGWSENPWEKTPTITTKPPRGPKIVEYCNKRGQFWPDGQEPSFNRQNHRKRERLQQRQEITNNIKEINCLKEDVRPTQSFTPCTGDILVYHDYSDYEGSDEDDFFELLDDNKDVSTSVLPSLPPPISDPPAIDNTSIPSMIVKVSHVKWMDRSKVLDPDDIELLSEILDIPTAAYYKLLPPSGSVVADFLKFKLPDMDDVDFTQEPESSFNGALAVHSLRGALNTAIWHGK
ncbi:hypothetical protein P692DRAFT_20849362 [Suillus brevipes Sb2]|nr:hypothetical protein P692DRAFT_20849362 [Suillus brevipes Sb2]